MTGLPERWAFNMLLTTNSSERGWFLVREKTEIPGVDISKELKTAIRRGE
jgi:hypothetical protein